MSTNGDTLRLPWAFSMASAEPSTVALFAATDAELVDATLRGRSDAFDIIVERHRRQVYRICYRFVSNHEDANDLAQDVFLRAFRALDRFRGDASLATWLYRIAVNTCLNRVTIKVPPVAPLDAASQVDAGGESAADGLLRAERAARVRAAVAQLPDRQRAALTLRIFEEMTHQEVAAALGTSVGAVKANVFHALRNVRRLLGKEPI